jgi:hypothetical protein
MRAWRLLLIAAVVTVWPRSVGAQGTAADGVDAFLRGEYERAAQILQPIAESPWPPDDGAAAFFMAAMYENGLGVPRNPARACALYLLGSEAGWPGPGPLKEQAMRLAEPLRQSMSREQHADCILLTQVGFEHGFQQAFFHLEQQQWVTLTLSNEAQGVEATVMYEGREKRVPVGIAETGVRFLPIEHTELTMSWPEPARRHFIEFFTWRPVQKRQWSLLWSVFEVVRDDLVHVTSEELLVVEAERPPSDTTVRGLASLRVNGLGDAEWVVGGDNPRSDLIEPDAERREVEAEREARRAADARMDRTLRRDPRRAPGLTYVDAEGCGNLSVYAWSADRAEDLTIRADRKALQLSTAPRMFDLTRQAGLEVVVNVFETPSLESYCSDHRLLPAKAREAWTAIGGRVTIQLSSSRVRIREPFTYRASVRIDGAEFVNAEGSRVRQTQPIVVTAIVRNYMAP